MNEKTYGALDRFRLIAAALVVAIHTSPLTGLSADADFFFTRILARIAVPFFFMVTGQFTAADCLEPCEQRHHALSPVNYFRVIWQKTKKITALYGLSILLYLPLGVYAGHYEQLSPAELARMLLFDGTFYHLWYFPACILGLALLELLSCFLRPALLAPGVILLYVLGLLGDSYYGFAANVPLLRECYGLLFETSSQTRNGIFFAPLFLFLGAWLGQCAEKLKLKITLPLFIISFGLMTWEAFTLRSLDVQRHDSMYLMLVPVMIFLYCLLLGLPCPVSKRARSVSAAVYVLHPAVIVAVRLLGRLLHLTDLLVDNALIHYLVVLTLSFSAAGILAFSGNPAKAHRSGRAADCPRSRAWIELDRKALAENVAFLKSRLPEGCRLMGAVKANAYGHGSVPIARELNRLGVRAFCVADVREGVELRKHFIRGEILVLGYTHPRQFSLLRRYRLTQTVLDYPYALALNQYGHALRVHLAIDTGMHRLGVPADNLKEIYRIWQLPHLTIEGMFTHLCACDVMQEREIQFTRRQISTFYQLADTLAEIGCNIPKLHIRSSYGILNEAAQPEGIPGKKEKQRTQEHYARAGIALYGLLSTREDTEEHSDSLRPVLSLKARVASVRPLHAGESAGYGMAFVAEHEMKIAAIAIGYGDGLPRALSGGGTEVLIAGHRAPVIGRICMDQTLIDVTEIPHVKSGDVAVLIGTSGTQSISAAEMAERAGTISNEILSRLGSRLRRIVV